MIMSNACQICGASFYYDVNQLQVGRNVLSKGHVSDVELLKMKHAYLLAVGGMNQPWVESGDQS